MVAVHLEGLDLVLALSVSLREGLPSLQACRKSRTRNAKLLESFARYHDPEIFFVGKDSLNFFIPVEKEVNRVGHGLHLTEVVGVSFSQHHLQVVRLVEKRVLVRKSCRRLRQICLLETLFAQVLSATNHT